nr:Chain B, Myosin XVa [Homo sapiens]
EKRLTLPPSEITLL